RPPPAGRGALDRGTIPAQSTGRLRNQRRFPQGAHGLGTKQAAFPSVIREHELLTELEDAHRVAPKPGMSRSPTHRARVLVVHFARKTALGGRDRLPRPN